MLTIRVRLLHRLILQNLNIFEMTLFNIQTPIVLKYKHWLLLVVLSLTISCTNIEPINLNAQEIETTLAGNTLVHKNKRNGFKWFLSQDGKQIFDPDAGFPVSGNWYVETATQQLCWWDVDPKLPVCALVKMRGDQIIF